MKKKITLEELEKRIEALENQRIVYVPQYPMPNYQPVCTCNSNIYGVCPVHGYPQRYIVTC